MQGAGRSSIVVLCLTECAGVMRGKFASRAQGTLGDVDAALAATSTEAEQSVCDCQAQ